MQKKRLPIGAENFEQLRCEDLYYVDKTGLIKDLFRNFSLVTLFTRPRRFGKSLNMSMLQHFFEVGAKKELFEGLAIFRETELCRQHMGQYPVISISLKGVEGLDFESAKRGLRAIIASEARRVSFLGKSESLNEKEKELFDDLQLKVTDVEQGLAQLSGLLYKHFGKKVVILIDEYDVPLDKAYIRGYYDEMVMLIRQMFHAVLKTNHSLQFAILTGCLRISRESIFTGLNNLSVRTIVDDRFDEWFGFTEPEVRNMLDYYGLSGYYDITKEWYDGYRFGKTDVYCPWDVINWCDHLLYESRKIPRNFWGNTSSNDLIVRFAEHADDITREQIERLIEGETVCKRVKLDLTYPEIEENLENLWSVLFTTGYLTQRGISDDEYELVIPNKEIRSIFKEKIDKWFTDKIKEDTDGLKELVDATAAGDAESMEDILNDCLESSISYNEAGNITLRESFYHGLLIGMLKANPNWSVLSNREAGNGRADIILEPRKKREGHYAIIIEVKYARTADQLEKRAQEALEQIEKNSYEKYFYRRMPNKLTYFGVAFSKKACRVLKKVIC